MPSKKSGPWLCNNCCECMFNEGKDTGIDDARKPLVKSKGKKTQPKKPKPAKKSSGPGVAVRSGSAYSQSVVSTVPSFFSSTAVEEPSESSSTSTIISDASRWSLPSNQYNSPASTVCLEDYLWEPATGAEDQYNNSVQMLLRNKYNQMKNVNDDDDLTYNDSTSRLQNKGQLQAFHNDFKDARGNAKYNKFKDSRDRRATRESLHGLTCHCKYCESTTSSVGNVYIPPVHGMQPERYKRTSLCYHDNRFSNTENVYHVKPINRSPRPFKPVQ